MCKFWSIFMKIDTDFFLFLKIEFFQIMYFIITYSHLAYVFWVGLSLQVYSSLSVWGRQRLIKSSVLYHFSPNFWERVFHWTWICWLAEGHCHPHVSVSFNPRATDTCHHVYSKWVPMIRTQGVTIVHLGLSL